MILVIFALNICRILNPLWSYTVSTHLKPLIKLLLFNLAQMYVYAKAAQVGRTRKECVFCLQLSVSKGGLRLTKREIELYVVKAATTCFAVVT